MYMHITVFNIISAHAIIIEPNGKQLFLLVYESLILHVCLCTKVE